MHIEIWTIENERGIRSNTHESHVTDHGQRAKHNFKEQTKNVSIFTCSTAVSFFGAYLYLFTNNCDFYKVWMASFVLRQHFFFHVVCWTFCILVVGLFSSVSVMTQKSNGKLIYNFKTVFQRLLNYHSRRTEAYVFLGITVLL